MKIRTGFVSNSSSTCFICGERCEGDPDELCFDCAEKMGPQVYARDYTLWMAKKIGITLDDSIISDLIDEYRKDVDARVLKQQMEDI
jgi:hypothetical protein